jgi:hypothetical protein
MMSLFADDAVLTVGDKTFAGKEQVRRAAHPDKPQRL